MDFFSISLSEFFHPRISSVRVNGADWPAVVKYFEGFLDPSFVKADKVFAGRVVLVRNCQWLFLVPLKGGR